jgi:hypothetical protein
MDIYVHVYVYMYLMVVGHYVDREQHVHIHAYIHTQTDRHECTLQVIGDIQLAKDLGDKDVLFLGATGLILAGPNVRKSEKVYTEFLSLTVRVHTQIRVM